MRWRIWLALLASLLVALSSASSLAGERKRVVVAELKGDDNGALRRALVRALSGQSEIYLVSLERAREVAEKLDAEGARALGQELGVVAVVEGKAAEHDGKWVVTLRVRSTSDGEVAESTELDAETRRGLAQKIEKSVWGELGPPLLDAKAPKGGKRRVVLGSFSGKKASTARDWVRDELGKDKDIELAAGEEGAKLEKDASAKERKAVAAKTGASALIVGELTVAGGKSRLALQVVNGADGEVAGEITLEGIGMPGLERNVKRELGKRLEEPLSHTSLPEPPEEEVSDSDAGGDDEAKPHATGPRPSPLEVTAGLRAFTRHLSYTDDVFNRLRAYKLGVGPAVFIAGTWYPLAHIQSGPGAHVGLTAGYEQGLALKSEVNGGTKYDTTTREWFAGVRARVPLDWIELGAALTYGVHSFVVFDQPVIPLVPNVRYRFVRLGGDARARFGPAVVGGHLGYRIVSDAGDIASDRWFPHASAGGLDLGVMGGYEIVSGLDLLAGIDYRRYFLSMHSEPGDANVAGGALDQFIAGWLGVGYTLPGGK